MQSINIKNKSLYYFFQSPDGKVYDLIPETNEGETSAISKELLEKLLKESGTKEKSSKKAKKRKKSESDDSEIDNEKKKKKKKVDIFFIRK